MNIIYFNGTFVQASDAKISLYDRSFLFGEGLFETFRSFDAKIPLLKEHLARLEWSSTFIDIAFPAEIDFQMVCDTLLEKNQLKNARFKIVLSQSPADFDTASASPVEPDNSVFQTNVVVFCERLLEDAIPEKVKLKTIKNYVNDSIPVSAVKSTNYLVKMRARLVAREAGYYDGILLNARGMVTETCTGNLFWLDKDSKLLTVSEDQGVLPGVMKQQVLNLLKKNSLKIQQGVVTPVDLSHSREVFMTNSVIGIRPVVAIDDRQISGGTAGDVTLMLMDLWKKKLG